MPTSITVADLVLTADGRAAPVKRVGRQTIAAIFTAKEHGAVRTNAGALVNGEDGSAMAELEAPRIKSARRLTASLRARIASAAEGGAA